MTVSRPQHRRTRMLIPLAMVLLVMAFSDSALAAKDKPNILVIFGDDVGISNISAYSDGLMGYETPNIDRIGKEGIRFLHYYGEQSCTAGRAAFLTGQHGIRTGLTKVGFPGAPMGISQLDPTIGGLLRNLGYATGQFGKNHVGDRNDTLPTVNGFDEFFGNLYHLNAEEEPELPDYPKDQAYRAKFGPRGVLKTKATDKDDPTVDPRFGKIGKQTIEDTGALTKKRMETIDDETSAAAIDFMKRQHTAGKPFFTWYNATRMHLRTHVRAEHRGRYMHGDSEYIDGMMEHDDTIGTLLKALDDMGIANNTIVVYSSDNGPHMNTWPDGAMTHFRSEKNTNWEGAFRVPCLVRWPGLIKPGTVTNELMSHNDWIPTFAAIAGEPDIINKLRKGYQAHGKNYKVHLDGYDQSAFLRTVSGTAANNNEVKSARDNFFYSDDDGLLVAMRSGDYKYVFAEQRLAGTMGVWAEPFTKLRLQKIFNLFQDPLRAGGHHLQHLLGLDAQSRRTRLRSDGRGLQVRGDVQGVSAAIDPAELQPGDDPGGDARRHQGWAEAGQADAQRRRVVTAAGTGPGRTPAPANFSIDQIAEKIQQNTPGN